MRALIDYDIFRYRYGFMAQHTNEEGEIVAEPDHMVIGAIQVGIESILNKVGATDFGLYLSGKRNFRYLVDPEYKANRRDFVKPLHYKTITDFAIYVMDGIVCDGIEADDRLAIEQTSAHNRRYPNGKPYSTADSDINAVIDETIICSIDKDLNQVPGWHFDFVKEHLYYVTPEEGLYNLYLQMLTGDSTDNIRGIPGIGPKKAEKILSQVGNFSPKELVQSKYLEVFGEEEWEKEYTKNWDLLYLLRTEEEAAAWLSRLNEAS